MSVTIAGHGGIDTANDLAPRYSHGVCRLLNGMEYRSGIAQELLLAHTIQGIPIIMPACGLRKGTRGSFEYRPGHKRKVSLDISTAKLDLPISISRSLGGIRLFQMSLHPIVMAIPARRLMAPMSLAGFKRRAHSRRPGGVSGRRETNRL